MIPATLPCTCGPCVYAAFEVHQKICSPCSPTHRATLFCPVGAALLDLALGEAGLAASVPAPVRPTNAMTRDLSVLTITNLADELRRWSDHSVFPWVASSDQERRRTAQLLMTISAGVRLGLISDWPAA